MIRKYHNHKLQTNPWHRKVEPHNNHETPGRQTKQSNLPLFPYIQTNQDNLFYILRGQCYNIQKSSENNILYNNDLNEADMRIYRGPKADVNITLRVDK